MIAEIISRLNTNKGALGLNLVAGAAEFQKAAESNPTATPAAYVLPMDETPSANQFSGDDIQLIRTSAAVVLVVRNVADARGAAVQADLATLRDAVKTSLLGWAPVAGYDTLSRGRSTLMAFRDSHMWWQDTYLSSFYERKP